MGVEGVGMVWGGEGGDENRKWMERWGEWLIG